MTLQEWEDRLLGQEVEFSEVYKKKQNINHDRYQQVGTVERVYFSTENRRDCPHDMKLCIDLDTEKGWFWFNAKEYRDYERQTPNFNIISQYEPIDLMSVLFDE